MVAWARSLAYTLVFYVGSLAIIGLAMLVALVSPKGLRMFSRGWSAYHDWCVRWLLGIRVKIIGTVPSGAVLVASRHESAWETIALNRLLRAPAVVLKQELTRIPLWGWLAKRDGAIPIDRSGSAGTLRAMMRAATAAKRAERPILLFPEGTRVLPGETPPIRAGFAGLYRHLNLPVVPVSLDAGKIWPRKGFVKRSGTITLRFGEPIPAGLPRAEAEARLQTAINRDPTL